MKGRGGVKLTSKKTSVLLEEAAYIKNTVVLTFRDIQPLHLMYCEVAWILVSSETQVQPHIILDSDYLPD